MYDYVYGTPSYDTGASLFGGLFASMGLIMLISSAVGILTIVSLWKIFKKAGKKGWECIVPIYNIIVLLEIVGLPTWNIVLFFVPIASIYIMFRVYIELAHKFGKSTGFGVLTVFFSPICLPLLAFGKNSVYEDGNNQMNNMTPPMDNMNNMYNQINVIDNNQNIGEAIMFNPTANTNINPIQTQPLTQQQFVNPTPVPTPVEPIAPTPIVNQESTFNFNQPIEPVTPAPIFNQPTEANIIQNATPVVPEPVTNNQVNTLPGSVPMTYEPQPMPQQPIINNTVNNFDQNNNQNM